MQLDSLTTARSRQMQPQRPLIVLSHLRWDFVFQRPQQLMTRLASLGRRVLFIEEPMHTEDEAHWERLERGQVVVLRPRTSSPESGFSDGQIHVICPMLEELVKVEAPDGF